MKYPKEYIEEITSRLKVSNVVGKTVSLKKRGKEFVGLSPFKNEKTPSFTVNDEKGFYHCFSSSEHGNIFDFLMKTQNLKFGEAVRLLASQAGLQTYTFSKEDEIKEKQWKIYSKILDSYKLFYNQELINNNNLYLKNYLQKRGISIKEINNFKLGYVPRNPNFFEKLSKEYSEKDLLMSGLFYLDEKNKRYVERFRDRLIFPINSLASSTIAFGGRTISTEKNAFAKYINSPETIFFKKGNNLFNLDIARKTSNQVKEIFLVEGYMDVLSLNKFEIMNVVANLGTALTESQVQLIWRFFNDIIICFDGDQGGKDAAVRAADKLLEVIKPDFKISFLFLPSNHDPDSFINKFGKDYFLEYAKKKISIHEFIWSNYSNNINTNEPSSMANLEKNLKQKFNSIKDITVRKYMLEFFYEKLEYLTPITNSKKNKFNNFKRFQPTRPTKQTKDTILKNKNFLDYELKEFSIIYLIINNLNIFQRKIELLSEINLPTALCKNLVTKIIKVLSEAKNDIFNFEDLNIEETEHAELLKTINLIAPIKFILKKVKNENEIIKILEEMNWDIKKVDSSKKIAFLENKLINEMSEKNYKELLEHKKQENEA
jgi:DNA primase